MSDTERYGSLAELLCALSFASDLAIAQPLEHGLKSAYVSLRLADAVGLSHEDLEAVYYGTMLKDAGCTACASSLAALFSGDDLASRRDFFLVNSESTRDVLAWFMRHAPADTELPGRIARLFTFVTECRAVMKEGMTSACEVGEIFARRLGLPEHVQRAAREVRERWNGTGMAYGLRGPDTSVAARIVHLAQAVEVAHSFGGTSLANALARDRSGTEFDPELVDAFLDLAGHTEFWRPLEQDSVYRLVLDMRPPSSFDRVSGDQLETVCDALADFADFKSRRSWNHSRTVADVAAGIASRLGLAPDELARVRRAALVHDLGKVAVSVGVLEKKENLSESEWEQFRLHPYYTERILARVESLRTLAPDAAADHEWVSGRGYPHRLAGEQIPLGGRIIAVADTYADLARSQAAQPDPEAVLRKMQPLVGTQLDGGCFDAFVAWLSGAPSFSTSASLQRHPGNLTEREIEVVRELTKGSSNRQIAGALQVSEKTVEHHLDHIYGKLAVSTRTAAVIWAVQQGLVD